MGTGILKDRFGRLFNMSTQQHHTIRDMGTWLNGSWHWIFNWRRNFLDRELDMVTDFMSTVSSHSLVEGTLDDWIWTKGEGGLFSVKSAYQLLQGSVDEPEDKCFRKLWGIKAPSNVLALAWKVLINRIQSKENLKRRGILQNSSQILCSFCSLSEETTTHLFFTCTYSWGVWNRIFRWLGFIIAMPEAGKLHFLSFQESCSVRDRRRGMSFIWLSTIWYLWNTRNRLIFQGETAEFSLSLDSIQHKSWLWLKGRVKDFCFSPYEWASNPLICLESL